jgi:hypothetical protein
MIRLTRLLSLGCLLAVSVWIGRGARTQAAPTLTNVCGALGTTTWTLAGSPYLVCNTGVSVNPGATLSIEPGVTVQFTSTARLTARGTLLALGTPEQPITFTGVLTTPGYWRGILVESLVVTPAVADLNFVTIEYGGQPGFYGANLYANNANITVTHSLVHHAEGSGVYHEGDGELVVRDTELNDNSNDAIRWISAQRWFDFARLTATGNGRDVIFIDSTSYLDGERHWPAPGIPYVIDALIGNSPGDTLIIDPGNELRFTSFGYLNIGGAVKAMGLPTAPITLTGEVQAPGSWGGLVLYGTGPNPAYGELNQVTLEYAGPTSNRGNITVDNGHLVVRHSIIRHALHDGLLINSNGRGAIQNSHIYANGGYGLRNNVPARAVLATNDWWGDPTGPDTDLALCAPGAGDQVTAGVIYRPVLTDTLTTVPLPLSDAPHLTLTPRRWYAPADGASRIYFDITLRDGDGHPLPGRAVDLSSPLGSVTVAGPTDGDGRTSAYLVSASPGDAEVTATLSALSSCEAALSPTSTVTFVPPVDITDLFPDSPAPYFADSLSLSPKPVIAGVLTTVHARLTNPLTVPITVDVSFGIAYSSIGVPFDPISELVGQVIPANSSRDFSASFYPPGSGHFCVDVTAVITAIGPGAGGGQLAPANNRSYGRLNDKILQAALGGFDKNSMLDRTNVALSVMDDYIGTVFETDPFDLPLQMVNSLIGMQLAKSATIFAALGGDPPRQDFNQLSTPAPLVPPPVQPGGDLTPARAAALTELQVALANVNAAGTAAMIALDRAGGATEAGDLQWASIQQAAVIAYNRVMGTALITAAAAIDNIINVAASEGVTQVLVSTSDILNAQGAWAGGLTQQQIDTAASVGVTQAELEALRDAFLAARPEDLTGDVVPRLQAVRDRFLELANVLLNPVAFQPGFSVGGSPGQQFAAATTSGNDMVQLYNTTATIQLANPLTSTALIDVKPRRLDLPADWSISVSPAQVTLEPGEQITVTVFVGAASPVPQGSTPTVAVEGYAGSQLLGGVVVQVLAPNYVFFDGNLRLYLPLVSR